MAEEAQSNLYIALLVTLYAGTGAFGAWLHKSKHTRWFIPFMILLPVLAGLLWGWSLGDTFPAWMKMETGSWVALVSVLGFAIPQSFTSRSKHLILVVAGIVLSALITVATTLYVVVATSFRGV